MMNGYGTLYYQDGSKAYEGDWKEDLFEGKGVIYNDSPSSYKGGFDYTDFTQMNN